MTRNLLSCVIIALIVIIASCTTMVCANEFSLFSDIEPFTLHIPVRLGLVGFNSTEVMIDTKSLLRSLRHTLPAYTPVNLDTGKPFNIQYRYIWDVYHVNEEFQVELEEAVGATIRPTIDANGQPIYTNNPRKLNAGEQTIPLNDNETKQITADQPRIGNTSPLYEVDISQIDLTLSDVVYKALSAHMKVKAVSGSNINGKPQYTQTKKGADKEYSIFLLNLRRNKIIEKHIALTAEHGGKTSDPQAQRGDYLYGYTTRKMADVIDARRNLGVSGLSHFGAYSYTNTWIGSGRVIFADLQAISSVGTALDRSDYFLEELLSNIYKNMINTPTQSIQSPNQQQQQDTANQYGATIDLVHAGLISWRHQQQAVQKTELANFFNQKEAGSVVSSSRANSMVPSLFDTSTLTSVAANPSGISSLTHYGMGRGYSWQKQQQQAGMNIKRTPTKYEIGHKITPLIAAFVASAAKQGLTTDMTTPAQSIPFFGKTDSSAAVAKKYVQALQQSVLSVPILVMTDHSYNIQVSELIDIPIIEKMLSKLSLSKNVKVIPLLHNVHTYPAVSTALFSSLDVVNFNTQPGSFYPGQGQKTILNGDVVSQALLRTSKTNPLLASIVPSTTNNQAFSDIVDSYKASKGISPAEKNSKLVGQHDTLPVFIFSLVALPQDTTVIYPSSINPEVTRSPHGEPTAAQKSYIMHLHDIHSTKNAPLKTKEQLTTLLRKELTLKVLDSLITRLTGTIPPYIKYRLQDLAQKSGLTSPALITSTTTTNSLTQLDTRGGDQRALTSHYNHAVEFRKQQMQQIIATTTTETVNALSAQKQKNNDIAITNANHIYHSLHAPGQALVQYIDSTWAVGLHPFGPYSTMYKYTKLYRDQAKRNVLIYTLNDLLATTWKTIFNTCEFIHSYGFLISNVKLENISNDLDGNTNTNIVDELGAIYGSSTAWNDIVGYVKEQGILESQLNCILYFTEGYFTPGGVSLIPEDENDPENTQLKAVLSNDIEFQLNEPDITESDIQHLKRKQQEAMVYSMKRSYIQRWLKDNNIKIDQRRMVDYLAIHPNAPIYVLQQLGWFIETLSLVDRQINILQNTIDNNINFGKNNKMVSFNDYWIDVYTQLYLLADKIATLTDVSEIVIVNVREAYASCRVIQVTKDSAEFQGFGFGNEDGGQNNMINNSPDINNVKFKQGISTNTNGGNGGDSTLKSALTTSTTKTNKSILKLVGFCFFIAMAVLILIFVFVFYCVDLCFGNSNNNNTQNRQQSYSALRQASSLSSKYQHM